MTLRRLLLLLVSLLVLAVPAPQAALAQGDQAAVAVNEKDDSSLFKLAFSIRRVAGDVVDQTNAAVAYASCENCRTVAVAFQVLLVTGDPSTVTPQNISVAVNEGCTTCSTLSYAYQYVFGTGGDVRFTDEGRRQIAELRKRLRGLRDAGLSDEALQAELDRIRDDLRTVVQTQLVPVGPRKGDEDEDEEQQDVDTGDAEDDPTLRTQVTPPGEEPAPTTPTPAPEPPPAGEQPPAEEAPPATGPPPAGTATTPAEPPPPTTTTPTEPPPTETTAPTTTDPGQ